MPRVPESIIEQLNSQADLVGMIRRHTILKPAGREFKGCCPFHGEKTPSFYVDPEKNVYHCFGCGSKGNAITFLRELERMSFGEALKALSEQTGIELPKDDAFEKSIKYKKTNTQKPHTTKPNTPKAKQAAQSAPSQNITSNTNTVDFNQQHPKQSAIVREDVFYDDVYGDHYEDYPSPQPEVTNEQGDLYTLLRHICEFYKYHLKNSPSALAYFSLRGLSTKTIDTFELGYAPPGWQHLEEAFPQDIEGLKLLGLVRTSQKGRDFDLLRDRVIFPIKDKQGRVVGFAGRALGDEMPKYINSSESPVFAKQHILYGLYESRQARANDYLMVEGYMDVIALYQAGIYGAVAPMGTAANEGQIANLLKYNDTLTLCFDGDGAGQRAAWRTLEVAAPVLPDGKQLKFLTLPNNHDPDTYIKAHGTDAMRAQIEGALSTSEYVFDVLSSRYDVNLPENKAAAMANLKELTAKFPKGSSFKWWLNNDIYRRLGAKDERGQRYIIDKANYEASVNRNILLYLCFLYAPHLLEHDLLGDILTDSGVVDVHVDFVDKLEAHNLHLPALPTWQSIGDAALFELTQTIIRLIQLGKDGLITPLIQTNDRHTIDEQAHFIMASLPNHALHDVLVSHWREFFLQIDGHEPQNISLFFNELLSQVLQYHFKKQQEQSKHIILSEIHKRRLHALRQWDSNQKSLLSKSLNS